MAAALLISFHIYFYVARIKLLIMIKNKLIALYNF